MWLDRLSQSAAAASPPNNNSRSGSPLPRRTGTPRGPYVTSQRAPPRGSSLSLVSSESSTSLLSMSNNNNNNNRKQPNGSTLRQSTTASSSTSHDDRPSSAAALALLGKLLGPEAASPAEEEAGFTITDQDLELDFDFGSLTLRDLAWSDEDSERQSTRPIAELDADQTKLEDLHKSIGACDHVLNSVETNLTNFRNDLALVSADIESLQARSTALNVRLENRKAVEKGLVSVVEDLSVSPVLVSKIADGHIDDQWVQCLKEVDRRASQIPRSAVATEATAVTATAATAATAATTTATTKTTTTPTQESPIKAAADLVPLLEKLVQKAIERIRDFLVTQIKALRSPHINAQIIQQQTFLKFKDLFTFLHKHHETLADEICQAYMNTMRWYYSNQFARYSKSLERLRLHVLDHNDVLGHDTDPHLSVARRAPGGVSSGRLVTPPHDAFSLGRRIDLLKGPTSQVALSSYLAEEDQGVHYLEVPFRHMNLALIDNATAEYTFLASFFSPALSYAAISRRFNYIFEPTFALGQALTKTLTGDSFDCIGVLLCIRLNQHFAFELQRRKVPAVDGYINATNMLLWPRFQVIMDHHCESMHKLAAHPASASSSSSGAGGPSVAPHVVTQRFGQLLEGILALSTEAGDDEPVVTSLHRLRNEVEAFLTGYSKASFPRDKRKRERFLYNNYSLVMTIIGDVHGGKMATDQKQHIEALKEAFEDGA